MDFNWNKNVERFSSTSKYTLIAGVVVLLSMLYPNRLRFKYEFQKGQVWNYETLVAPFDFVIHKLETELRAEKAALEESFVPVYRLDESVGIAQQKKFADKFDQKLSIYERDPSSDNLVRQPTSVKNFGEGILWGLYQEGILELQAEHGQKGDNFVINIIQGNVSVKRTKGSLFTLKQAEQFILDTLKSKDPAWTRLLEPLLKEFLVPSIIYDPDLSERLKTQALTELVSTKGVVKNGEVIISKGTLINDENYDKLVSYRRVFHHDINSRNTSRTIHFGYFLLTALLLTVFMMYIHAYRREIFMNWNYLIFVLMWLVIFSYISFLVEQSSLSIYIIPFCIVPIIVRHFFTYRLAFFTHVVVVTISSFLTSLGHQFIFMQIVAGVVAVLAVADARAWSKFFQSVLLILTTYLIAYLGLSLIEEGDISKVDWTIYNWIFINAILTLLAFPIIPIIERTFGFISSISLVELSDLNRPLLRELSMKAPGTMQHSLQVANIAEAAANAIGANALLVRVGALYHDVGKMFKPEFFIENQANISPHKGIDHYESSRIILEHVTKGAALAKKYGVPQKIINFIFTHHGTTKVEYFYRKCLQDNPGVEIDETFFTYIGPKPSTKEETILMLADSIEATSRSLNNPSGEDLDNLVDITISGKVEKEQLVHSSLTYGDLEKCRAVFKKMMRSIYHIRIEYPKEING